AVLHIRLLAAAIFLDLAEADGEDLAPLRFLFGAIRDDDAAHGLFAFVEALNDQAVVQWCDFHVAPDLVERLTGRTPTAYATRARAAVLKRTPGDDPIPVRCFCRRVGREMSTLCGNG